MIVIGDIIFVVAFLGCCGALQENACMIRSVSDVDSFGFGLLSLSLTFIPFQYAICLIIIITFEIGIGVAGFVKRQELSDVLNRGFNQTLTHYKDNEIAWKFVQTEVSSMSLFMIMCH